MSLLLAGFSFAAATLQAGALRGAIFIGTSSEDLSALGRRSLQASEWGVLAAALMFGSVLVATLTAPRFASSPRRVALLGAFFVVPLVSWAVALGSRELMVDFIHERLPLVQPLRSFTEGDAPPRVPPSQRRAEFDRVGRTNQGWSAALGARANGEELKRTLRAAWRSGVINVNLSGSAGALSMPLFEGLERRVAFASIATTIRLRGAGRCEACDVSVTRVEGGLIAQSGGGSMALWTLRAPERPWDAPGADFVGPFPGDAELIDASLIANAHGHVLVLAVE